MAILRRRVRAAQARLGEPVRSVAIGCVPEFVGTLAAVAENGLWVNVRDAAGRCWHRSWGDLRPVEVGST